MLQIQCAFEDGIHTQVKLAKSLQLKIHSTIDMLGCVLQREDSPQVTGRSGRRSQTWHQDRFQCFDVEIFGIHFIEGGQWISFSDCSVQMEGILFCAPRSMSPNERSSARFHHRKREM